MITPEEKDKVVAYIMSMDHISSSIFYKSVKGLNVTENEFYMILEQLDRMGLIKQFGGYSVTKRAELDDFVRRHARGQAEERRGNNQRDKRMQLEPGDQHDQPDDGDDSVKQ